MNSQINDYFKQTVIEALQYYDYCLVDSRDKKIFYIGKGIGYRVFNHDDDSFNGTDESLKSDTIREIHKAGLEVSYYIVRHGMTEEEVL